MKRVICDLPNASDCINGVKFTEDRGQMISEELSDEVAEGFAKIPGYKVHEIKPKDGNQVDVGKGSADEVKPSVDGNTPQGDLVPNNVLGSAEGNADNSQSNADAGNDQSGKVDDVKADAAPAKAKK